MPPRMTTACTGSHRDDPAVVDRATGALLWLAAAVVPGIQRAIADRRGRYVFVANLQADETGVKDVDLAGHLRVLGLHDLTPDVVVTQRGGLPLGDVTAAAPEVQVVEADVDRPHGLAHDSDLLGAVLAGLV